jgi:hypothetical protein
MASRFPHKACPPFSLTGKEVPNGYDAFALEKCIEPHLSILYIRLDSLKIAPTT